MIYRWLVLLACTILSIGTSLADPPESNEITQDLRDLSGLSGSIRMGAWSSSRNLDDHTNLVNSAVWLQANPKLSGDFRLYIDGYLSRQDLFSQSDNFDNKQNVLREAYVDARFGLLDARIGKQIIVWGRADRFKPTDNLTPRNFTLLTVEDDDQRLGTPAVNLNYRFGSTSVSAVWLSDFQGNTIPIDRRTTGVTVLNESVPDGYRQAAIKLDHTGESLDWSASFYSGYDQNPDLSPSTISSTETVISLRNNRIKVFGLDAATTTGRYGFRTELAYTVTEDNDGSNPFVKNSYIYGVVGVERVLGETLSVNLQYLGRYVIDYHTLNEITDPVLRAIASIQATISNQRARYSDGITVRVSERWCHQTLDTELSGIYLLDQGDYALRLKIGYAIDDRWRVIVGTDVFRGDSDSFYGRLRDNSTYFAQLKLIF